MRSRLAKGHADQSGIAMVIVMSVMLLLIIVGAGVASSAAQLSQSANTNRFKIRALEAAQAGIDVANYRLNRMLAPTVDPSNPPDPSALTDLTCLGPNVAVTVPTLPLGSLTNTFCPGVDSASSDPSLDGASYTYWTSKVITDTSQTCAGTHVTFTVSVHQRCIVSVGTAGHYTRRLEQLVQTQITTPSGGGDVFPANLYAKGLIHVAENGSGGIRGNLPGGQTTIGTNTGLKIDGTCASPTTFTYDPGASHGATPIGSGGGSGGTIGSSSCSTGETVVSPARSTDYADLGPVDSFFDPDGTIGTDTSVSTNNDNALLATAFGVDALGTCVSGYRATSRCLADASGHTLTLNGANPRAGSNGLYVFNLCSFSSASATSIVLTGGAKARFLIDSSSRMLPGTTTSACSSAKATPLALTNPGGLNCTKSGSTFSPGNSQALQFFVYGGTNIQLAAKNQCISASLLAMTAYVQLTDVTTWFGALATNASHGAATSDPAIDSTNSFDFNGADDGSIKMPTSGALPTTTALGRVQGGWSECSNSYSSSSPAAGC